jgi:hypothetical protein
MACNFLTTTFCKIIYTDNFAPNPWFPYRPIITKAIAYNFRIISAIRLGHVKFNDVLLVVVCPDFKELLMVRHAS